MRIFDLPLASLHSSGLWFSTALLPVPWESVHSELRLLYLALGAGSHLCAGRVMLDSISKASCGVQDAGLGWKGGVGGVVVRMGKGKACLRNLEGEWLTWL